MQGHQPQQHPAGAADGNEDRRAFVRDQADEQREADQQGDPDGELHAAIMLPLPSSRQFDIDPVRR